MFNLIEKSGTGIEKSGTGIEKSGTGIEKSGTGMARGRWHVTTLLAAALFAAPALASDPEVLVTAGDEQILVSVHTEQGILVGRGAILDDSGYFQVALYSAVGPSGSGAILQPMVAGSGSGKEVAGSGSGKEVAGSGSGKEVAGSGSGKEVAGSGSGKEVAGSGSGKEVAGSGSGKEVAGSGSGKDVAGSGSGSAGESCVSDFGLEVAGSGSGSATEGAPCAAAWGVAEVVVDENGAHVVVHQIDNAGMNEFLVAFLPGSGGSSADDEWESDRGFVLTP
ncbi:hypothetical protein G4Y73_10835 [Wenzhouxiangella sp. XN201]|uniref:hypothetical protein n=1 Tax=Wenzhouxiangella sp. XN201 TaxID=2710755 RepID=UPI0013C8963A|nr:hypothetical protein [Wenzhouxiangella sp. XN201]NEZ04646.1 hypothetical protein [Wenzhouxiangella sp. XN201]